MKKNNKISIIRYISICFSGIILVMAVIMILFISYFSNKAIYFDIRTQIKRETRYDFKYIKLKDGKIQTSKDFVIKENHVQKIIIDEYGKQLYGHYPDEELKDFPISQRNFRQVKTSSDYYYIFDRPIVKRDKLTNKQHLIIIRSVGKKTDFDSQYKTMKYISYIFIFALSLISILLIGIVSSRLTIPMKKIKDTADTIGKEGDLTQRINYTSPFKEMDAMIQANNRMMDRLEDLFQQQQQFTSDVAHELRTPASIISAECQYLNKYGKTIDDFEDSLNVIHRQITKTNEIITQLLQLSRLEQGRIKEDFEYTNLKDLIESVCDSEPLREKKHIVIYSNLDDISIYINVGLMAIAIKNLINNAMKYSDDNSCIKLRLWEEKNHVSFEVKDYGCGMSEETQKHIYDRFYRADKSRNTEGFGLGLALVHKIIEIHKGEIFVKSELGEGSVFTITFPQH